jgi:Ser/Thr protein kinase RdoA (MazF antagonist)
MEPDPDGEELAGGSVASVVRVGDTVRRVTGPWTPAVHALLRHLERRGFAGAPRVLGIDARGREILTYIEGDTERRPWHPTFLADEGIAALGRLIAGYHAAVADFVPPSGAVWRIGAVPLGPGEIIRHGDLGPWNTIWRGGQLIALIDWDFAEPGTMLDELAQAAWDGVPLRDDPHARECGFTGALDRRARLAALCAGYSGRLAPREVVAALLDLQLREAARMVERGGRGEQPWAMFLERGGHHAINADRRWLVEHAAEIV